MSAAAPGKTPLDEFHESYAALCAELGVDDPNLIPTKEQVAEGLDVLLRDDFLEDAIERELKAEFAKAVKDVENISEIQDALNEFIGAIKGIILQLLLNGRTPENLQSIKDGLVVLADAALEFKESADHDEHTLGEIASSMLNRIIVAVDAEREARSAGRELPNSSKILDSMELLYTEFLDNFIDKMKYVAAALREAKESDKPIEIVFGDKDEDDEPKAVAATPLELYVKKIYEAAFTEFKEAIEKLPIDKGVIGPEWRFDLPTSNEDILTLLDSFNQSITDTRLILLQLKTKLKGKIKLDSLNYLQTTLAAYISNYDAILKILRADPSLAAELSLFEANTVLKTFYEQAVQVNAEMSKLYKVGNGAIFPYYHRMRTHQIFAVLERQISEDPVEQDKKLLLAELLVVKTEPVGAAPKKASKVAGSMGARLAAADDAEKPVASRPSKREHFATMATKSTIGYIKHQHAQTLLIAIVAAAGSATHDRPYIPSDIHQSFFDHDAFNYEAFNADLFKRLHAGVVTLVGGYLLKSKPMPRDPNTELPPSEAHALLFTGSARKPLPASSAGAAAVKKLAPAEKTPAAPPGTSTPTASGPRPVAP